jgi:hypothetical protein
MEFPVSQVSMDLQVSQVSTEQLERQVFQVTLDLGDQILGILPLQLPIKDK